MKSISILSNTKAIKISDYLEFVEPKYIFLKVTPSNGIRNYNSGNFISLVSNLYVDIRKRIRNIDNKLFFECNSKLGYYVYIERKNVEFYFIVPEKQYALIKDKAMNIWNNKITVTDVSEIPMLNMDCTKYYMTYKKIDALSLSCDARNNILLTNQLSTLNVMENGDKLGIFYNFIPTFQKTWKADWDRNIDKLKQNKISDHNKFTIAYVLKFALTQAAIITDSILDSFNLNVKQTSRKNEFNYDIGISSKKKRDSQIAKAQIICMSESEDKNREYNNAISLCNSFECLNEDNKLIYKPIKGDINLLDAKIKHAETFTIQPKEGQNFISLPARELLDEYKFITHTNVLEAQVPEKLRHGYICLGDSIYKGSKTSAYLRDTYDQGNLPLVLIGEQGSGKTTYITNYVSNITQRKEGAIVIDFIKNCELSDIIANSISSDRLITLDLSDIANCQGIGYNELKPRSSSYLDILDVANRKSLYVQMLIDALNVNGEPLSTLMDRYLSAACNVVFLNPEASLKDVVRCLNDYNYRRKCIDYIRDDLRTILEDEITALNELDSYDSKTGEVKGTSMTKVDGINHRINLLKKDMRLKMMFNKPCNDNLDMVKAMDDGKIILVKMPQEYFSTPYSKNVITTYFLTKIWSSMLVRGGKENQPQRFHVIIDEVFQAKTAMKLLSDQEILPQTRKFGCKFIFSCQYLGQIEMIAQTIRSAGASYMLMKGSGKANFVEFKDELAPFTLEDLEALPQYHSLNLINYEDERAKFVTKLPKPL